MVKGAKPVPLLTGSHTMPPVVRTTGVNSHKQHKNTLFQQHKIAKEINANDCEEKINRKEAARQKKTTGPHKKLGQQESRALNMRVASRSRAGSSWWGGGGAGHTLWWLG